MAAFVGPMNLFSFVTKGAVLVVGLLAREAAAQCAGLSSSYATTLGPGYSATLIANGLQRPRGLLFDKQGNLLVVESGTGLRMITLTEAGSAASSKVLIPDPKINHGIALSADESILFVSGFDEAYAYKYDGAAGTATDKKTVIGNMTNAGYHFSRTLLVPKYRPDLLLLARGSDGNVDLETQDINVGRSEIKMYKIAELMNTTEPLDMAQSGTVLGWGLRNIVGYAEHPITGGIWSVENSMDDIKRQDKDVHNDNPAEKLNYHGVLNDTKNSLLGAHYGYPTCVAVWNPDTLYNPSLKVGSQFVANLSAEAAIDSSDAACDKYVKPRLVFAPHTAPIDIKFKSDGRAAYITFHGSWDRQPPDGYRLSKVEFGPDGQPKASPTSFNAAIPVMANTNNTVCPGRCFRPTGLAWGPNGKLYMASDSTGQVFMIGGT